MPAQRTYRITEVEGRRLPWRVHLKEQSPSSPLAHAFSTEEEANEARRRLSAPMVSVPVTLRPLA